MKLFTIPLAVSILAAAPAQAATVVADYLFNGTLSSSVSGAPDLIATDPAGVASFSGGSYRFGGSVTPASQGGLSFDNSGGLLASDSYSIFMSFTLDTLGSWKRLIDVNNRQSDNGLYYLGSAIQIYPLTQSPTTSVQAGQVNDLLLTVGEGFAKVYFNGSLALTQETTLMDIDNSDNLVNLFLDNVVGGGRGEWSGGTIDRAIFYNGVVGGLDDVVLTPAVPEIGTWAMMIIGMGGIGGAIRRRRALEGAVTA